MEQIINSLLENDMYKFSMGQAIYHQYSDYKTTWTFKCRNEDVKFTREMVKEIRRQIKLYCGLRFKNDELEYLNNIKWIKGSYIDFLKLWQPQYDDFVITDKGEHGLTIETFGTWLNTMMYEVPVLAIVNEVYFRMNYDYPKLLKDYRKKLKEKIRKLESGEYAVRSFSEFGLRRRLSGEAQDLAVKALSKLKPCESKFLGTSNVYLARKYNVTPVGTMAHEWIMCVGQGNHRHNPAYSNYYAMDSWVREYSVLNGIALTDTITTDCFLRDFHLTFATLFSGVRHDSGDPFEWADKMLAHYRKNGIDPKTKTLLFSDSLNFEKATAIYRRYKDDCQVAFGIGTYISNDTSVPPLNIVMKVTRCNSEDVAKISDTEGKEMCKNPEYVDYLRRSIKWRMENEKVKYNV
ncbi:MAG: nicotinate phosphoribosyltransferase [Erysipelotrichaceae bacterium]|nr:nicotinate phosphoribosyltransferase [Erysipelotrichaceae bacterium]